MLKRLSDLKKIILSKKHIVVILSVLLLILFIWTLWINTALALNRVTIVNERLPESFAGYRIAHMSDLHNAEFGEGYEKLLALL